MLLVLILSVISAFGYQTLDQEEALQNLREGTFDIILDIRTLEDFETLRLDNAFHMGSLMHRRHRHRRGKDGKDSESESSSDSSEDRPHFEEGERPPLEAHVRRLHGCEDVKIAVHSMGGETNIEAIFSTTEVAAKLSELGFNNVFDLGDVSVAREHEDIPKASGERTGKCRPECVIRRPHHGHRGCADNDSRVREVIHDTWDCGMATSYPSLGDTLQKRCSSDLSLNWSNANQGETLNDICSCTCKDGHGRRPRPNGESKEGALGMEHGREKHRSRHGRSKGKKFGDSSSSESTEQVLTSFAKYFGITFGSFVVVAMIFCMYQKYYRKQHVVLPEEPEIKAIPEGSGEGTFVVSFNDPETGSPIETINGSPEGLGETTEPTELPPSFEEVYKSTQDATKHAVLTE